VLAHCVPRYVCRPTTNDCSVGGGNYDMQSAVKRRGDCMSSDGIRFCSHGNASVRLYFWCYSTA